MIRSDRGNPIGRLILSRRARLLLALPVAALLAAAAYRIGRLALAENFARSNPEKALQWSPDHPIALRARAEELRRQTPHESDEIKALLRRSLIKDPVDGRSFGLLGMEAADRGRDTEADRLIAVGIRRAPRDFGLRVFATLRSLRTNRLEDATRHLVALLQVDPDMPYQNVAWLWYIYSGSVEGKNAVMQFALEPRDWRPELLRHIATHSADPAEVLRLFGEMERRKIPATSGERDQVIQVLFSRQFWVPAFALWVQDPALADVRAFANVFNGDFERELGARVGFDWELTNPGSALVAIDPGTGEGQSLRIEFLGIASADALVRHRLLVGPGRYELQARVRTDGQQPDHGPVMVMTCMDPRVTLPLATFDLGGERGSVAGWRVRTTGVEIPGENCAAQLLEVRQRPAEGPAAARGGTVWLDDVTLVRDTPALSVADKTGEDSDG